jgi:predicted ATPase
LAETSLEDLPNDVRRNPSDQLRVVTFADLRTQIEGKAGRTTKAGSAAAWHALLVIIDDLVGSPLARGFDAVTGHRWSLTRVEVRGYQGVSADTPLYLDVDPTPGITVVHGPNGAGKSSVADAIDAVMHGKAGGSTPAVGGTGGKTPLWERVHCGRDAEEACVKVTLADGAERLHLTGVIDEDDVMATWTVEHEHLGRREVVSMDSSWNSAVLGHQPVFAYGALERRIQTSGQLQKYLDLLIALGGCFTVLDEEVNRRCAAADAASREWQAALDSAEKAVWEVDGLHLLDEHPPPLHWPNVGDDPDAWLASQQLTEQGSPLPVIDLGMHAQTVAAAEAADQAIARLDQTRLSTLDRLADGLSRLSAEAQHLDDPGSACPVCGTDGVDWRSTLATSVAQIGHLTAASDEASEALLALKKTAAEHLASLFAVTTAVSGVPVVAEPAEQLMQVFRQAVERSTEPTTFAVAATRPFIDWCRSDDCRRLFEHAAQAGDRHRQWLRARHEAVSGFVAVWRQVRAPALPKKHWDTAKKHLATLEKELRQERAQKLGERAGSRISALLNDAGVQLKSIEISKTRGDLVLHDQSDAPIKLGMLSSGQRNALLLAPLLAMTAGGPFGFVVLDDPVHAFDGLRVDRLAAEIVEIAQTRRVIVLTHDERLREHLLAVSLSGKAHQIDRDPATGVVTLKNGSPMWDVLLNDASEALGVSGPAESEMQGTTDVVRGLCRQALDDGLRDFVIRLAGRRGASAESLLGRLGNAHTTRDRMRATAIIASQNGLNRGTVNRILGGVNDYLDGWNRASHGNLPLNYANPDEVKAVRQACTQLMKQALR